jgi:hypothetical protein
MNTYTAAGIGVQCFSLDKSNEYSGRGMAQITDKQIETEYGLIIKVGGDPRGSGVRCYIPVGRVDNGTCSICQTRDQMVQNYGRLYHEYFQLENKHDQTDGYWAQIYMRRRIQQVVDHCKNCSETDIFITAALGQNGSGFDWKSAEEISSVGKNLKWRTEKNGPIDWNGYFVERIEKNGYKGWFDTRNQLNTFANVVWALKSKGWYVPPKVEWDKIWPLARN